AKQQGIKVLFNEPDRVQQFTFDAAGLFADLSKTHITAELVEHYTDMANEVGFADKREQQFAGARINVTEDRSVLHTMLRDTACSQVAPLNAEDQVAAQRAQQEFLKQVDLLRNKHLQSGEPVKSIVHIGIGGSSLGPQLLYEALAGLGNEVEVHFVSNIDAHEILAVLSKCDPAATLIFGVSKTFTTEETLMNIHTAEKWMSAANAELFKERFFAITASHENASKFGVQADNIIVFPEWVGGRYSIWSSVSLSVALVLGREAIESFLSGAAHMDAEFYSRELGQNLPFLLASLDHFYCNYFNAGSKATFAYDYRLTSLVPYLQQLETESNGKDRDLNGDPVQMHTSPVVWGGTGTDMQHSTFQLIHQGTQFIPVEFILVKRADHDLNNHHNTLLSNGVAQAAALLTGRTLAEVEALPENQGLADRVKKSKVFAGNKPSTTFVLESLTPYSLGALLALYEHRTFCGGVLSSINSFDQMGVELGKKLAKDIEPVLSGDAEDKGFDASTRSLLARLKA
ncbi:MAG: glucose-6-phosphate isomerase, partial [Gammaproteobacteria bacterium]|nr:glucose-6-phosphate isomerase [Gammaproteobacteria bacterium]